MSILSYEQLQKLKPCAINDRPFVTQLIEEVEFGRIQKLLGTTIYNKIREEVESGEISAKLQSILDKGLYRCIAYYTYARYIQESGFKDTFSGVRVKTMSDSTPAPVGSIKNIVLEYTDLAMMAFQLVKCDIDALYGCKPAMKDDPEFDEIIGIRRSKSSNCGYSYKINYFE